MDAAKLLSIATSWLVSNAVSIISAIIIVAIGLILAKLASNWVKKRLMKGAKVDKTVTPILTEITFYSILILTLMLVLAQLGVQSATLLAILGGIALAVVFGLRDILTNIASGIMIVVLRPMSVGDYITASNAAGSVSEIGLFATRMVNADGLDVFLPNSQIWGAAITNYSSKPSRRLDIRVEISYDDDIEAARRVLTKIADSEKRVLKDPAPAVHVDELNNNSITVLLRVWVPTKNYWDIRYAFTEQTVSAFDEAGIEIFRNSMEVELAGGK